jgi:hypothetical protein
MNALLEGVNVLNIGAGGIVSIGVLAVFRGWLVPRRVLNDLRAATDARVADKDTQIARIAAESEVQFDRLAKDKNDWKDAYTASSATNATLTRQNDELMESARVSAAVLAQLPKALGRGEQPT